MLYDILALFSLVCALVFLDRLANVFPSLVACVIRWKESVNLEASVKLGRDRDLAALLMFIPFCLTVSRYSLYAPAFLAGMGQDARLGVTAATATAYLLIRNMASYAFRNGKINPMTYKTAGKAFYSFFVLLTLCLLSTAGIMSLADIDQETVKCAMLWVSALAYMLFLVRKTQIFMSSCSLFTAFSYLCALEIIPTGALMVSAFVF